MKNYYRILNVGTDASDEEIKKSYYALAKRYHPDHNKGDRAAARRFDDVREAYTILSDPEAREEYDRKLEKETNSRITAADLNDIDSMIARRNFTNEQQLREIQFRAQVQAQAQAQIRAQSKQIHDKAYKEGYERGLKEGSTLADKDMMRVNEDMKAILAENEIYKKRSHEYSGDRSDLEQELFERDRELAQSHDKIAELEEQLKWLRTASQGNDALLGEIDAAHNKGESLAQKIASPASLLASLPPEQQERRLRMKEEVDELCKKIDALETELGKMAEQRKQKLNLTDNEKILSGMENRAQAWAKKVKEDERLAKTTLYGSLGVLIWATDEEVRTAYTRLRNYYAGKNTTEGAAKVKSIDSAYAILSDPVKRRRYNASIGCPEERIELERRLIHENASVQQQYRSQFAANDFWGYFDQLSALALSGDADAQNALGELYMRGERLSRDPEQAAYWFREAFEQKHPAAIYNLGQCYISGEGIARNTVIGQSLLRQAGNLGYTPPAQE